MKCKMPTIPKVPNPIQRRPDGKLEIVGLTPMEWFTTTLALVLLYAFMAGFCAVLILIADRIRHAGDSMTEAPVGS